jgi:hypothetical protein
VSLNDRVEASPDGRHEAHLVYEADVRWGPPYYRLRLDGQPLAGRHFGRPLRWSPDSRYLAAQEWLTTDYEKGPITRAVLFDITRQRWAALPATHKGFAESFEFAGDRLSYREHFPASAAHSDVAIDVATLGGWTPL